MVVEGWLRVKTDYYFRKKLKEKRWFREDSPKINAIKTRCLTKLLSVTEVLVNQVTIAVK